MLLAVPRPSAVLYVTRPFATTSAVCCDGSCRMTVSPSADEFRRVVVQHSVANHDGLIASDRRRLALNAQSLAAGVEDHVVALIPRHTIPGFAHQCLRYGIRVGRPRDQRLDLVQSIAGRTVAAVGSVMSYSARNGVASRSLDAVNGLSAGESSRARDERGYKDLTAPVSHHAGAPRRRGSSRVGGDGDGGAGGGGGSSAEPESSPTSRFFRQR